MSKIISGVYVIRCKATEKYYVGSSSDIQSRWRTHKWQLKRGEHHSLKLQRAWDKYGESEFELQIVEEVLDGFLTVFEQTYINSFDSYRNGYNGKEKAGGVDPTLGARKALVRRIKSIADTSDQDGKTTLSRSKLRDERTGKYKVKEEKSVLLSIRVDPEHDRLLRSLLKDGQSLSDKVREAIAYYLANNGET